MLISSIVEEILTTGVLSPEQEETIYQGLCQCSCTEADLNALEILLNKLVSREVRYSFPDRSAVRKQARCQEKTSREKIPPAGLTSEDTPSC